MGLKRFSPTRISFWIIVLMLTGLFALQPHASNAQSASTASVNSIQNGDFEGGIDGGGLPVHWENTIHDCQCTPGPTITVNNTESISGYAARLDIGQTSIGFMGVWQSLPQNTFFSNFTQRPDQLDFWFRLDPKYAGLGDFQIKFLAANAQELDYVIDPHLNILSYPNQTFSSGNLANQGSVNYILLGRTTNPSTPLMAPPDTWVYFARDVTADWAAPIVYTSNSTCTPVSPCRLPGFSLTDAFNRIEFDNIGFQDSTGYHGMAAWIDNVNLYETKTINLQPDFQLSANPSLLIPTGTSANSPVTVSSENNFTGTVSLSASSPIQNITASPSPNSLFLPQGGTVHATVAISVANSTTPGTYSVTLTGQSGALSHSTFLSVTVILPSQLVNRQGWSLTWQISHDDGIVLNDVSLNGTALISDARLPGIYSTYVNNTCGPFYEEPLSNYLTPSQVQIESTFDGGFQIIAPYFVGGEYFHQVWKFLPDGTFQGLLTIGIGGCLAPHFYEARWRYDFSLAPHDTLITFDGSAWRRVGQDAVIQDAGFRDIAHFNSPWAVTGGGRTYFFSPTDSSPVSAPGSVLAVVERPNEIEVGHGIYDPTNQNNPTQWVTSESLIGQDTSFWYASKHFSPGPVNSSLPAIVTGLEFHLQNPSNLPPIASFTMSTANPNVGQAVMFNAGSSYDPNGNITSYQWKFGDGSPMTSGVQTSHAYIAPGNYTVSLTVNDNAGRSGTKTAQVRVSSISTDEPPVAMFSFNPVTPFSRQLVIFDGSTSFDTDGKITRCSFDFGDQNVIIGIAVQPGIPCSFSNTYLVPGNYTVVLTVTDNDGNTAVGSRIIHVIPSPSSLVTDIRLNPGEELAGFSTAVMDPNGYAYFGGYLDNSRSGEIVKIRLSDFARVATLPLQLNETVGSLAIDNTNGFVYLGTGFHPGAPETIVKVRLSDFTRVSPLILNASEDCGPLLIDTRRGFLYCSSGLPGHTPEIIKIRLSDFSRVGTLTLQAPVNSAFSTGVIDTVNGFAYYGATGILGSPAFLTKVNLSNLTQVRSTTLNDTAQLLSSTIDPSAGYAYFGAFPRNSTTTGLIVRIRLSDLTEAGSIILSSRIGNFPTSAVIDPGHGFAYFGNDSDIIRIRLSDFSNAGDLTLVSGENLPLSALIDLASGFLYFGGASFHNGVYIIPGVVTRVSTTVFTDKPPIPVFFTSLFPIPVGHSVQFDGSGSSDPDGSVTNWYWSFGDGTQSTGSIVNHTFSSPGNYTVFLTVLDNSGNIATTREAFQVRSDFPPVASFTFSPPNPRAGDDVSFNGFPSFDPDGSMAAWSWSFGDGITGSGPTPNHIYSAGGSFSVTLTVTDNAGLTGTARLIVPVISRPLHDVGITLVSVDQSQVFAGQVINVHVGVVNSGLSPETVDVTVYYGSHVATVLGGVALPAVNSSCNFCGVSEVNVVWDTTGVPAGNYTLSVTMFLASDPTPADNTFVDGNLEILPPPVIAVTPNSGSLGDEVVVHGSNFPAFRYGPGQLEITFDNELLGFMIPQNGSFTFTFNVPHADPTTPHHIHALQLYPFSLDVQASFTVLPEPTQTAPLKVEVDSGILYFPGDTAAIYISTSQKGQQVAVTSLQVVIVKPDGSKVTLSTVQVSTGLWRASFTIPSTRSTGTYAVMVRAHTDSENGSALGSFEVKQTWLSANGRGLTTVGIVGSVGAFGILALAWRRGVFKRKDEYSHV